MARLILSPQLKRQMRLVRSNSLSYFWIIAVVVLDVPAVFSPTLLCVKADTAALPRYAVALFGAVCQLNGFDVKVASDRPDILSPSKTYCRMDAVAAMYDQYLFGPNGGRQMFDIFGHTWNGDISDRYIAAYAPVAVEFGRFDLVFPVFERRAAGCCGVGIAQSSRAFSIMRALQLVRAHEEVRGEDYDFVVLMRPDIVLAGEVRLD